MLAAISALRNGNSATPASAAAGPAVNVIQSDSDSDDDFAALLGDDVSVHLLPSFLLPRGFNHWH